ncbi:MAG: glycoside hydrolase family 38 N-terminal domain-containing protein [Planctomycetota bacterium]
MPSRPKLPKGAGDPSAFGEVEKGREHRLTIDFPAKVLEAGTNTITITSLTGSWILYDYLTLRTPVGVEAGPLKSTNKLLGIDTQPFLIQRSGELYQPVMASVLHLGEPVEATVTVKGSKPVKQLLKSGYKVIEGFAPQVTKPTSVEVNVKIAGKSIGKRTVTIKPIRKWEVYLLHHSHVDIGYTHVQTEVVRKHWGYFEQVIELARKSADYPPGSRFKWNVEVLWAVDSYLKQASKEKREQFIEAVRKGWIALDALYGNELTALCRPEELVRLVDYAQKLRQRYGFTINSAMITDVPGYTWGIVPVLAQSGVEYFSVGPNRGHRIGYTLSSWGDKPFYWESPSGKRKVLCWVAGEGYSLFHAGRLDGGRLFEYLKRLEKSEYPYDMLQVRYSIGGDNGPPDPGLSEFVKKWNEKYAYPKLVVSTASEMCREFERRYGDRIPKARGDFTPYWEDGAGSSARETSMNRDAAERLVQAETLWAMLNPAKYPAEDFYQAWREVILYDEHTWGAHCSISQPDSDFTKAQWKIKQAFALEADAQSHKLLNRALAGHRSKSKKVSAIDVFNTCSWPRTDLVVLPKGLAVAGELIKDVDGKSVSSQRLSTGELAFVAKNVPPFGAKRFTFDTYPPPKIVEQVVGGAPEFKLFYFGKYRTSDELKQVVHGQFATKLFNRKGKSTKVRDYTVSSNPATNQLIVRCPTREDIEATLEFLLIADVPAFAAKRPTLHVGHTRAFDFEKTKSQNPELTNGRITLTVGKKTGAIKSLKWTKLKADLVDHKNGLGLNDYFYVAGRNPKEPQRNGPVKFRVKERGPVVASLLIESDAPGCNKLSREVRLVAGSDHVDIINVIDKQNIYKQEAVHLAFPFNVPKGIMRMDTPWSVVRPETDQLPGACKNYFTVQRWVDVSNSDYGVTWATVDAPLVEVGAITNDPRGGVGWIKKIEPSTTLYSYVMNNYWETNYKAGQEGPTTFRYSIMPHRAFDSGKASKFAIEQSQPLIAVPVDNKAPVQHSVLSVEPADVIVTAFKPSEDGKAWIVRLFNIADRPVKTGLIWTKPALKTVWLSNLAEDQIVKITEPVEMAAYEFLTLRVPRR